MPAKAKKTPTKPNILVIWGDDVGITNLSCYSNGLMGYQTPNIDRLAKEGMRFTDSYGEQSCTEPFANEAEVDVLINQPQQMVLWNVIFQSEVVEQRFRTGVSTHHAR